MCTVVVQIQWVQHIPESDTDGYNAALNTLKQALEFYDNLKKDTDGFRRLKLIISFKIC